MGWIAWKLATGFIGQHGLLTPQQAGEFSMWVGAGLLRRLGRAPGRDLPARRDARPRPTGGVPGPPTSSSVGFGDRLVDRSHRWWCPPSSSDRMFGFKAAGRRSIALVAGVVFIAQMAVASHLFTGLISALLRSRGDATWP